MNLYCWNIVIDTRGDNYKAPQRQIYVAAQCVTKARCAAMGIALREAKSYFGDFHDCFINSHKRDLSSDPCVYPSGTPVVRGFSLI